MISLSKIIKSNETSLSRAKVIEILQVSFDTQVEQNLNDNDVFTVDMDRQLRHPEPDIHFQQQEQLLQAKLQQERTQLQAEFEQLKQQLLDEQIAVSKQAWQEGMSAGYQDGIQKANQEYLAKIEQAKSILENVQFERLRYLTENEPFMIELICEIAKRVIHRQLQLSPDLLVPIVKQALQEIQDLQRVEVRVHPDDYEYVFTSRHSLIPNVPGQNELYIIPDVNVTNGGCVIQTEFGTVDARVDTQLAEIKRVLVNVARGTVS